MEVSALSVSIDIDISAFVDAMEQVAAILIATAEEFEQVANDIENAFKDITKSGQEAQGFWEKFFKVLETAAVLKDVIEILAYAFEGLKYLFKETSVAELVEGLGELTVVIGEAITPVGWLVLGLTAAGLAIAAFSKSSSDFVGDISKK